MTQDRLGRGKLVDAIASQLLRSDASDPLVIAINAPWGAGKSSFLHLLHERLDSPESHRQTDSPAPILVRFNPWLYSDVQQLITMFFGDLARAIGTDQQDKNRQRLGESLMAFGVVAAAASAHGYLPPDASPALLAAVPEARKFLGRAITRFSRNLMKAKSLPQQKHALDKRLAQLPHRVVVLIDDIDRLEPQTTRLLFRMLRLTASFPKVTYVLAFDRGVVEKHLTVQGMSGRAYLEKIVQVGFDLPVPDPAFLDLILREELTKVRPEIEVHERNQRRYYRAYKYGFKTHFQTIRNIKRYTNGLRMGLPIIASEIDAIDYLIIELIRMFHPEVYSRILHGKNTLIWNPLEDVELMMVEDNDRTRIICDLTNDLCDTVEMHELRTPVKELLRTLFPVVDDAFKGYRTAAARAHASWREARRICSPDVFDKYFLLAVPQDKMSETELADFRLSLSDLEATRTWFKQAHSSNRARDLLDRSTDFIDDMSPAQTGNLARVICDSDPRTDLQIDPDDPIDSYQPLAIVFQCVRHQPTQEQRCVLLLKLVEEGDFLLTVMSLVDQLHEEETDSSERFPIDDDSRNKLWQTARVRLASATKQEAFWTSERWYYLLWVWLRLGGEEEIREAVARFTQEDEHLLRFVEEVAKSQAQSVVGGHLQYIDEKDLGRWLDVEKAKRRLEKMGGQEGSIAARATKIHALFDESNERRSKA